MSKARDLANLDIKIVIGPVFNNNIAYLDELTEITFLSLTNKNKCLLNSAKELFIFEVNKKKRNCMNASPIETDMTKFNTNAYKNIKINLVHFPIFKTSSFTSSLLISIIYFPI